MKNFLIILLCLFIFNLAKAEAPFGNPGEHTVVFKSENTSGFGYYEYLPQDFDAESGKKYPVLIFLHGLGENGNGEEELSKVKRLGPPKYIEQGEHFNGIIISPQHASDHWSNCFSVGEVKDIYDYIIANYPVDIDNINLTGVSCGAIGSFYTIRDHPEIFNKALLIAGNGIPLAQKHPDFLAKYDTEIWMVHGLNDGTVASYGSKNTASILDTIDYTIPNEAFNKEFNGTEWVAFTDMPQEQLALTLFESVGHNSWTRMYDGSAGLKAMEWLFNDTEIVTSLANTSYTKHDLTVSPNPTNGIIRIKNIPENVTNIIVSNNQGQIISKQSINSLKEEQTINLSNYSSGAYIIRVISEKDTYTVKVLKHE